MHILLDYLNSYPIRFRTRSYIQKNPYLHPRPSIMRSDPNPTNKSGLEYGKGIIRSDPIRFHP